MNNKKGFTLIELLIVMAVIAILIAIAIPSFRGMQNEARKTMAIAEVRVIGVGIESYYKNHNDEYPAEISYQSTLIAQVPWIIARELYDPFGATSTTQYLYDTSTGDPTTAKYYIVYSVGPNANGTASVDNNGNITVSNEAIYYTNGSL